MAGGGDNGKRGWSGLVESRLSWSLAGLCVGWATLLVACWLGLAPSYSLAGLCAWLHTGRVASLAGLGHAWVGSREMLHHWVSWRKVSVG